MRKHLLALGISLAAVLLLVAACRSSIPGDDSTFTSPGRPTKTPEHITGGPFVQVIDPRLCIDEDAPEPTAVAGGDSTFVSPPRHYPTIKDRERARTGMSDRDANCIARLARAALPREATQVLFAPGEGARDGGNESVPATDFRFTV
ncbi:MAG: hypothetical protein R2844_20275, partial [Caldilineales bacterium]